MQYTFSYGNPTCQFIYVDFVLDNITTPEQKLFLPFWRPGRYEKGSFAKNIQEFQVYDSEGNKLEFTKEDSHCWVVKTNGKSSIRVKYNYHAADLNAGSTYVDKGFLYSNPINLCLYAEGREEAPCQLKLELEEGLPVYGALPKMENGFYQFESFHQMADTPFICSKDVTTLTLEVDEIPFHLHFWGYMKPPQKKVLRDFKKYIQFMGNQFPEYPFSEYHFLFLGFPHSFHHGVEHKESTVIALGPGHSIFDADYNEFLSISCHELYHAWNVKSIRPIEFWPYRYNEESYSRLGYLCEGVTTYLGNLLLLQSGVWNFKEMGEVFEKFLERHANNFGRFNLSVADSSFDTWLDGYERGIPNRKVSIYNEGALISFFLDCLIRKTTEGAKSIHDFMASLYTKYYKNNLGVSENDFWETAKEYTDGASDALYRNYVDKAEGYQSAIAEAFDYLGLEFEAVASTSFHEAHLGVRLIQTKSDGKFEIYSVYPGSEAEIKGLQVGDKLLMVNDIEVDEDFSKWLAYFQDENLTITVKRNDMIKSFPITTSEREFYKTYKVRRVESPSVWQREAFNKWSCKKK